MIFNYFLSHARKDLDLPRNQKHMIVMQGAENFLVLLGLVFHEHACGEYVKLIEPTESPNPRSNHHRMVAGLVEVCYNTVGTVETKKQLVYVDINTVS